MLFRLLTLFDNIAFLDNSLLSLCLSLGLLLLALGRLFALGGSLLLGNNNSQSTQQCICNIEAAGGIYKLVTGLVEVDDVCKIIVQTHTRNSIGDLCTQRGVQRVVCCCQPRLQLFAKEYAFVYKLL